MRMRSGTLACTRTRSRCRAGGSTSAMGDPELNDAITEIRAAASSLNGAGEMLVSAVEHIATEIAELRAEILELRQIVKPT